MVPAARRYLPGHDDPRDLAGAPSRGWLIVRDVLLVGPWHDTDERSTHAPPRAHGLRRRPRPAAHDALRQRLGRGPAGVRPDLRLRPPLRRTGSTSATGYGEAVATRRGLADQADADDRPARRLRGLARPRASRRCATATPRSSRSRSPSTPARRPTSEAYDRLVKTADYWHQWLAHGTFPDHPWRQYLQRSRADAQGPDLLAHRRDDRRRDDARCPRPRAASATGTTATRWVRDSTFMLWGLHSLGFEWEANDYFYFMQDAAQADDLQVMYGIQGERELIEETLDHLSRLRQRPPRADRQRRLQPAPARRVGHDAGLDLPARQVPRPPARAPLAADRAARRGRDRELAEARPRHLGGPRRGQALRLLEGHVLGRVRPRRAAGARCARPTSTPRAGARKADEIKADIIEHGCKDGVFTQHYDTDALDASALLIPLVRFLPPDDERVRKTVMAIADHLTVDGLVLRYRVEETDDGLQGEEGTFTICSFWLVSALSEIGEHYAGPRPVPEAARLRVTAAPLRGGDRPAQRPAPGQLPAGVHAPGADQRGHARDPRRREARRRASSRSRRTTSCAGAAADLDRRSASTGAA